MTTFDSLATFLTALPVGFAGRFFRSAKIRLLAAVGFSSRVAVEDAVFVVEAGGFVEGFASLCVRGERNKQNRNYKSE